MSKERVLEKNKAIISKYIPEQAADRVCQLIFEYDFKLVIKQDRKGKWGDFKHRSDWNNCPVITINKGLNKYAFLITLIHEIAHCKTFREYGNKAEAHGLEWKRFFQILMNEFLNTDIMPVDILYVLRKHMQNPSASANADIQLYKVLLSYDDKTEKSFLLEYLKDGERFYFEGEIYQRISKRRKKIECVQLNTRKKYLFSPVTEVNSAE